MGCLLSTLEEPAIETFNNNSGLQVVNRGDGTPETMLLSFNGVPYVWRRDISGEYSLKKLADTISFDLTPSVKYAS